MTTGIYKIEDKKGKIYVGSSVNIESRWNGHISALNIKKHGNQKLQRAWNKHGAEYFTFSIIEIVDDVSKLLLQEQKYLNILFHYNISTQHYNIQRVAGSQLGYRHTEESKAKMSLMRAGKKRSSHTEESKAKMSLAASKTYILRSPDGAITSITNLKIFCKMNNLNQGNMHSVANGKRNSHKGWTKI